jgi:hypothetical protein
MHHNHSTGYSVSIQGCTDVAILQSIVKTGNHRARKLATSQINYLAQSAKEDALAEAKRVVVERKQAARQAKLDHAAKVHAARSAAAKRAAQTVKARKLAASQVAPPTVQS